MYKDIVLSEEQITSGKDNAYNIIAEYVRRYWKHYGFTDTVLISLGTSYGAKGEMFDMHKIIAYPNHLDDIEFDFDWWEGERFIRLYGIKLLLDIDVSGGIYEE